MDIRYEEVNDAHLKELLEIYNYYVTNSTATFQISLLNLDMIKEQLIFKEDCYKSYVILDKGNKGNENDGNNQNNQDSKDTICGYVALTQHKKREAFDITAEVALYLAPQYIGKGIGPEALKFIEEKGRENKFHSLIATITAENERSVGLFEKMGYEKCAYYKEVGKKFDKLLGLVVLQKFIVF